MTDQPSGDEDDDEDPFDGTRRPAGPPEGLPPAPPPPPPTNEGFEGSGVRFGSAGRPEAERDPRRLRRRGQDPTLEKGVDSREMWRIFRITSEIVEGIDRLRGIRPAITMWGSARLPQDHPHCRQVFQTAKTLAEMGYTIVTGGGPGIMEAANRGA